MALVGNGFCTTVSDNTTEEGRGKKGKKGGKEKGKGTRRGEKGWEEVKGGEKRECGKGSTI